MDMSLSFRIISKSFGVLEALFSPSNAKPPLIAPSPITATTCRWSLCLAATAIPNAAEIELLACPHVKVSYSLSRGLGNGQIP